MTVWDSMALNAPHTEREIRSIHETGAGDLPTKLDGFPLLEEAIKEHFGQRCDEYMAGCPCCDTWAELDRLRAIRAAEARELAQDGEPAPGSTTEPENATCPSAGVSEPLLPCPFCGGPARHSIIPDGGGNDVGGEFIYCFCCASSTGVSFRSREELFALWNRRHTSQSQAILTAIAAEKAEWPHAGVMHAAARTACDNIAERVKKLMGVA